MQETSQLMKTTKSNLRKLNRGTNMKSIINSLKNNEQALKDEIVFTPMDKDTRLKKVQALEKIGDAINLLESIN